MKLAIWEAGEKVGKIVLAEFLDQALPEGPYHYTVLLHNLNKAFIVYASLSCVFKNFWFFFWKLSQDLYCVAAGTILAMYEPVSLPSWILYIQQ